MQVNELGPLPLSPRCVRRRRGSERVKRSLLPRDFHSSTLTCSYCRRLSIWPADSLPEGGRQQRVNERASSEGGAVHRRRRLHLWRLRAVTEHGRANEQRKEGRKERVACGGGDGQKSKEPLPALLRSTGCWPPSIRQNERTEPAGDGSGIFSFPAAVASGYARGHSMEGIMCMQCAVHCMRPPRAPPPCAADQ